MATTHYAKVTVRPPPTYRGGTPGPPKKFYIESGNISWSWGSEAAQATLVYTADSPVATGESLTIEVAGHTFYGRCTDNTPKFGTSGLSRSLTFVDNRTWLNDDRAYCAFNIPDKRIVNGRLVKRYRHLLPSNFNSSTWTFTDSPLSAATILNYLFSAPTTEDPWTRTYHSDQNYPVFECDFTGGPTLRSAIQEVSDKQGLVFTLLGGPYSLVWARKGEGVLPSFPATSDERTLGTALSGNATRMRVLGDRNVYQVHNIEMVKDWKDAWVQFFDQTLFTEDIFQRGTTTAPVTIGSSTYATGTTFRAIAIGGLDTEQIISRQLAAARALEITVREYAALRGDTSFKDFRKFAGRSRMDMPCALYISQILFRAFRFSDGFSIRNADGLSVPVESLTIFDRMVAQVTHNQTTGVMSYDVSENPDGNGYGIIQGYQVGKDFFKTIKPERFNINEWNNAQAVWQHIEFSIDDSGEPASMFILFDEPVIRSSDLVTMINGYGVFNANPTFTTPPVKVALCFQAEKFSYIQGTGAKDDMESVSGLFAEHVQSGPTSIPAEVAFADGLYASQKAATIATSLLARQYFYAKGSHTTPIVPVAGVWPAATVLTGVIDRVSVAWSAGGISETVDYTSEFPRVTFIPERDLDRGARARQLLPGQAELRQHTQILRLTAAALGQDAKARRTISDAWRSMFGVNTQGENTIVVPTSTTTNKTLAAGTPLFKSPNSTTAGVKGGTHAVLPTQNTSSHKEFVGVTVQDGQVIDGTTGGECSVVVEGSVLARVMGPAEEGQTVGYSLGTNSDYLNAASYDVKVGRLLESITVTDIKLVRVSVDRSTPSEKVTQLELVKEYNDFLECKPISGGDSIFVAKPAHLCASNWINGWVPGDTITGALPVNNGADTEIYRMAFKYIDRCTRWKMVWPGEINIPQLLETGDGVSGLSYYIFQEVIDPPYMTASGVISGENGGHSDSSMFTIINAIKPDGVITIGSGLVSPFAELPANEDVTMIDLNSAARQWKRLDEVRPMFGMVGTQMIQLVRYQGSDQNEASTNPAGFEES